MFYEGVSVRRSEKREIKSMVYILACAHKIEIKSPKIILPKLNALKSEKPKFKPRKTKKPSHNIARYFTEFTQNFRAPNLPNLKTVQNLNYVWIKVLKSPKMVKVGQILRKFQS